MLLRGRERHLYRFPFCSDKLVCMGLSNILATIDAEIARLQQARALLASTAATTAHTPAPKTTRRKRVMSAEARKRIAEAQRKRWAAQKKATAKAA